MSAPDANVSSFSSSSSANPCIAIKIDNEELVELFDHKITDLLQEVDLSHAQAFLLSDIKDEEDGVVTMGEGGGLQVGSSKSKW